MTAPGAVKRIDTKLGWPQDDTYAAPMGPLPLVPRLGAGAILRTAMAARISGAPGLAG